MARATSERVKGVLRVGVFALVVTGTLGMLSARSVYGDIGESSMVVGRELSGMKDLVGGSHRVHINGEPVFVASAMTEGSVDVVLDRFEALCRENSQGLDEAIQTPETSSAKLPADVSALIADHGPMRSGILRKQGGGEGVVACLAHSGGGGISGLATRLATFAKSKDLGDVGKLRYVYARREDGEVPGAKTHVVTVWTDGSLKVAKMFATEGGETPGSDPSDVPRPEGAVRLLTAEVDGAPYGVRIYQTKGTAAETLAHYETELPKLGWDEQKAVAKKAPGARAYSREGVDLMVFTETSKNHAFVSLVEMQAKAP